jgi:hypothetical protein
MVQSLRGQENDYVKVHSSHQEAREGQEALRVGKRTGGGGSRRADLGDLLFVGLALFCLGILLSFLATATTPTEVSSAPAQKAVANVDGEALVQLDKEASAPLSTPAAQEGRQTEEGPLRASLLTMLVVAVSPFFRSGLSLLARNSSLKGVAHPSLGVLGGLWAAGCGGASVLGVFLLRRGTLCSSPVGRSIDQHLSLEERSTG